ncbi:MAG TPA: ABC transporter permease [Gemmataceae bacterium]|nr:ABC transporter permease [Gemmataceae bacterium]
MVIGAVARKEFRLLLRDRLSAGILFGMPLFFILVLGLLLGEGFGQKTDNRLRVSLVNEDLGYAPRRASALFMAAPGGGSGPLGAAVLQCALATEFEDWSTAVQRDLGETAGIRVEVIESREQAQLLVDQGRRAAVLVFGPHFTERVHACSFLADGINPFYRDGVDLSKLDASFLTDRTQLTASAIIEQVGQGSLLRVILPWMIGKAFSRLSDPDFIERLGKSVNLPVPTSVQFFLGKSVTLQRMLDLAAGKDKEAAAEYREKVGRGVKKALQEQFSKYNLLGKNWADLNQAEARTGGAAPTQFRDEAGSGWLRRGAARYQILVPSYAVLFAFALVLPVGWLFVTERRQGTLKRLKAAPVTRGQVLLGKFLPCLAVSLVQGVFLLVVGKLVFGMGWGPASWPLWRQALSLLPVVAATSLAAMGLAMLLAAVARTEMQVALVGSLLVLLLGLLSGCLIPRELMPEAMIELSRATPHAWALDAYRQLLTRDDPSATLAPNLAIVTRSCLVLAGFGVGFLALAWGLLRLE